jgi:tRNA threonylcarbamoyladenosine biosynthesis protein TsaE
MKHNYIPRDFDAVQFQVSGRLGYTSLSAEETYALGESFAKNLPKNAIVALCGDLGAGKTTFVRGLVAGAGTTDPKEVSSPTFTYLHIYPGEPTIYHFDLYRLPGKDAFFSAGFDEYFNAGGICCLEWAEKLRGTLPSGVFTVNISYLGETKRQVEFSRSTP